MEMRGRLLGGRMMPSDDNAAEHFELAARGSAWRMTLSVVGFCLLLFALIAAFKSGSPLALRVGAVALCLVMAVIGWLIPRGRRSLVVGADGVFHVDGKKTYFWPLRDIRSLRPFSARPNAVHSDGSWSGVSIALMSGDVLDIRVSQATVDTSDNTEHGTWMAPDDGKVDSIVASIRNRLTRTLEQPKHRIELLDQAQAYDRKWLDRVRALTADTGAGYRDAVSPTVVLEAIAATPSHPPGVRVGALMGLRAAEAATETSFRTLAAEMAHPDIRLAIALVGSGFADQKVLRQLERIAELTPLDGE